MTKVMRKAQSLVSVLSALFLTLSASLHAEEATPQVVELLFDNRYAPASYVTEDGELRGFHQQILQLIDDNLPDYDIVFKAMDWRLALKQIEVGDAVGVVGPFFLGDVRPYMHPYSRPLYGERVIVICNPDVTFKDDPVTWPTSFANKLMLNIQGYDGWLDNKVRHRRFTALMNFLEVPNIYIAAQIVSKGNADCSLYEELALSYMQQKDDLATPLKVEQVASITEQPVHVGYSFAALQRPEFDYMQEFIRQFDFAVYKLQQEGKIDAILTRFKNRLESDKN